MRQMYTVFSEGQSVIFTFQSRRDKDMDRNNLRKFDTENKQANNNNMLYDGSNSDNQSSKYPFLCQTLIQQMV